MCGALCDLLAAPKGGVLRAVPALFTKLVQDHAEPA